MNEVIDECKACYMIRYVIEVANWCDARIRHSLNYCRCTAITGVSKRNNANGAAAKPILNVIRSIKIFTRPIFEQNKTKDSENIAAWSKIHREKQTHQHGARVRVTEMEILTTLIRTNKITKQNNVMCTVYLIATTTPATYLLITHDE